MVAEEPSAGGGRSQPVPGFWGVIPAGGAGTRLWPLSRTAMPKFLHDLTGSGRSLLQSTWDRLGPVCGERVVVVTGERHVDAVRGQLPGLTGRYLLAEPSPRESMPAIGLAAALIEREDPDAVVGSFAADHVINDVEGFHDCVREAVAVARQGQLVTIGIEPTYPAMGFGYIRMGEARPVPGAPSAHRVRSFVEKPDRKRARRYQRSGDYRWNAGMFVVGATVLLDLLASYDPALAKGLREIAAEPERLGELWPTLQAAVIDRAVAEPAAAEGRVSVIPATFDWDDVGDFASLATLVRESPDDPGLKVLGQRELVVTRDTSGIVLPRSGRTVVTLGMDDVVVVDTPDALLVTNRERAQDVKAIVEILRNEGRSNLT